MYQKINGNMKNIKNFTNFLNESNGMNEAVEAWTLINQGPAELCRFTGKTWPSISYSEKDTEFNESLSDFFRSAHAAIDPKDLVRLETMVGKPKFPSENEFDDAVEYLDIDRNFLFYNKADIISPIIYWKGLVFYPFHGGLKMEALKMFHSKESIEKLSEYTAKMISKKDYESVFSRMEKKILIPTFVDLFDEIPDSQKYDIFTDLYVRSEYGFERMPEQIMKKCFDLRNLSSDCKKRMEELGKKMKIDQEGKVTVYRGQTSQSQKEDTAYSWTLSRKTAQFFADRFSGDGKVIRRKIDPELILDYLDNRGEQEVLIRPNKDLAIPALD